MTLSQVFAMSMILAACAGCTSPDDIALNSVKGAAKSWCSQASNCDTGGKRDPLQDRPAWEKAGGTQARDPFPRQSR